MSALQKLIAANLDKLDDLLSHSSRPVELPAMERARESVTRGIDPVWAQAEAKGLPLSDQEIEARAQAMGFNRKAYHGTEAMPQDYDPQKYEARRSILLPVARDFDELRPREIEGDLRLGPSTISTYLGPHVARDPQMSYSFSGFRPDRLAPRLGMTGKVFADMPRDEINAMVNSLPESERSKFWRDLDYELEHNKYGRILPLRLRGDVRDLPQTYEAGWDRGKRIHDDRAVDIDVATHALTTDPTWLQADTWHALEDQSMEFSTIENMLSQALRRGNPEDNVRRLVQSYYEDLKPLKLTGNDPQVLEHMLDDYRTDYSRTGRPLLRYQNTVEDEYAYSPSEDAYIILDPSAVRSESAIFDPDLKHLSGLNYAGGGQVGKLAKIVAAALRGTDNEGKELIVPGRVHAEAVDDYLRAIGEEPDRLTGGEIDDLITDLVEHGFIDETGAFLTRKEAAERAAALDQLTDWGKKRYGYQEEARSLGLKPGMEGLHTGEIDDITDDDVQKALNLINPDDGYAKGGAVKSLMAAVRDVLTGKVYKGPTHAHAIYDMALDKYGDVDAPDIMSLVDQYSDDAEDGFITPRGRFMTREQAAKYMKPELKGRYVTDQDELFSEDLGIDVEKHQNELAKELDPNYYLDEAEVD